MKKLISVMLVLCMLAGLGVTAFASFSEENQTSKYYARVADVNMDYIVNAADARRTLRNAAGLEVFYPQTGWTGADRMLGDINFDGKVTAVDARIILRVSARLENFPDLFERIIASQQALTTKPTTTEAPTKESESSATYESYFIKATIKTASQEVVLEAAYDGKDYRIDSDGIIGGLGILYKDECYYLIDDEGKSYFKTNSYTEDIVKALNKVNDLNLKIVNFDELEKFKTSTVVFDDIPHTLIEMTGAKYYLDATGKLCKIEILALDGSVKSTITVDEFTTDADTVAEKLQVPADYATMSYMQFMKFIVSK